MTSKTYVPSRLNNRIKEKQKKATRKIKKIAEKISEEKAAAEPKIPRSKRRISGISERERVFVNALVRDKLPQGAALRVAGWGNPNTKSTTLASMASKIIQKPKIQRAIAAEREEWAKASAMTKKRVMDGFTEAIDMAKMTTDPMAMIAGWREIGKMCGFYEPIKHQISVNHTGQVLLQKLQVMSDDELLALAGDPSIIEGEIVEAKQLGIENDESES